MKKIVLKILPALLIGIALIVSALIFERGINTLAAVLSHIPPTEMMYHTVQDFPRHMTVKLYTEVPLRVEISGTIKTKESTIPIMIE